MFELIETPLEDLVLVQSKVLTDDRGSFIKTFQSSAFEKLGLGVDFKERYYSISKRNVIRGMHFQVPPYEHAKLITVLRGRIVDVVLDIRKKSPTFGKFYSIELAATNGVSAYLPPGFAHGFKAIEDDSIVEYSQTTEYGPKYDCGIRFDSFGFDWGVSEPIISQRDLIHPPLSEFKTPF